MEGVLTLTIPENEWVYAIFKSQVYESCVIISYLLKAAHMLNQNLDLFFLCKRRVWESSLIFTCHNALVKNVYIMLDKV